MVIMELPKLNVLLMPEFNYWVAVGLEYFLVARAATPVSAIEALQQMCELQPYLDEANGQKPFAMLSKAPEAYWTMFQEARAILVLHNMPNALHGEFRLMS
jgi:hypothetical protein